MDDAPSYEVRKQASKHSRAEGAIAKIVVHIRVRPRFGMDPSKIRLVVAALVGGEIVLGLSNTLK